MSSLVCAPVVVFCSVPPSLILPGPVLGPGLPLLALSVVDWESFPWIDLEEMLVLLVSGPHLHSANSKIYEQSTITVQFIHCGTSND